MEKLEIIQKIKEKGEMLQLLALDMLEVVHMFEVIQEMKKQLQELQERLLDKNKRPWSIQKIWNEEVNLRENPQPRDYIRASEIGSSYLDRLLKMKGEPPTNPYDERTLRVFEAGHIFEWILQRVLKLAGILQETQKEINIQLDNCLPVKGHLDFIAGGLPDWKTAKEKILAEKLPDWLQNRSLKLIEHLAQIYPDGLEKVIIECKSVNSLVFWAKRNIDPETGYFAGYPHHKLQLLTYLLGTGIEKGKIFYISKDDLCLLELDVIPTDSLKREWEEDVRTMTAIYRGEISPPEEEFVVLNPLTQKYEVNWKLLRSIYLTKITGLSREEFEKEAHKIAKQKNKELKNGS